MAKKYVWNKEKGGLLVGGTVVTKGGEIDLSKLPEERKEELLKKKHIVEGEPEKSKTLVLESEKYSKSKKSTEVKK